MPSSVPGHRYSEEEISYILRRRRRAIGPSRRNEGISLQGALSFLAQHEFGVSSNLCLLLVLSHALFPGARDSTGKFMDLQYHDTFTETYAPGKEDIFFVLHWVLIFTALRSGVMKYVLEPLAAQGGIIGRKAAERFSEQGWLILYYVCSFLAGLRLWASSKYWLNLKELWTDFPETTMSGSMKWYYLVQFGFWIQQIIVVNMERRRKDYWQMFTHHIITCILLFTSYSFYMTRVGNVILCLMDLADIILSSAKVLKYLAFQTTCDVFFGLFILLWLITRHIFYPMVLWSVYADLPVVMPLGCYSTVTKEKLAQPRAECIQDYLQAYTQSHDVICFDSKVHWQFLSLLSALMVILLVWFGMIVQVALKVVRGQAADDSRSDSEESEEPEEEVVKAKLR